ncbi:hypothetical protein ACNKHT_00985 [Shigella flexneri]
MAALGDDSRLAAMLVSGRMMTKLLPRQKLLAIVEEPPRMGNSDLGVAFAQSTGLAATSSATGGGERTWR